MLGRKWSIGQLKKGTVKGKKLTLVVAIFTIIIVGLTCFIYYYNKPHVNVKKSEAAFVLKAENLIKEYRDDEIKTSEKYSENIIQVRGKVFEVSTLKGNSVITLKDENSESSIICHMLPDENMKALKLEKGQEVDIKGICTGYLLDVIIVRCTLVE